MQEQKKVTPPQWVIDQQRRPQPINPRNYLRPNPRTAKVIDLNKMVNTWGENQAKFKEGDIFVSKKLLQTLNKSKNFIELSSQEKFKKNLKVIVDVISGGKGEISYKFQNGDGFLREDVLLQNYVHHHADQVWKYYLEKNKNQKEIAEEEK